MKDKTISRRSMLKTLGVTGAAGLTAGLGLSTSHAQDMQKMPNGAGYYSFKLGDFKISIISDGQRQFPGFPNWGPDEERQPVYKETLDNYGIGYEPMTVNFNPMLVDTGTHRVLVDTGFGGFGDEFSGQTVKHLAHAGYDVSDIDTVFITHWHGDHIGGLMAGEQEVYPNANIIVGEVEHDFWLDKEMPFLNAMSESDRLTLINDGDEIVPGLNAVMTPGHTSGHMAVQVASGDESLMHFGDAGGHQILSLMYPEHHLIFDADKEQVVQTRARIFEQAVTDNLMVIGYHFAWPGAGRIVRDGSVYRFSPKIFEWGFELG